MIRIFLVDFSLVTTFHRIKSFVHSFLMHMHSQIIDGLIYVDEASGCSVHAPCICSHAPGCLLFNFVQPLVPLGRA